jgi:hypothetical protein
MHYEIQKQRVVFCCYDQVASSNVNNSGGECCFITYSYYLTALIKFLRFLKPLTTKHGHRFKNIAFYFVDAMI